MPTSYQAPMRQDQEKTTSHSQSQASNISGESATVEAVLARKGREVFAIKSDQTLHHAVEILRDKRIGALMVLDQAGALCGILSERDIVRKLADTPGQTLPQMVADVMTREVQSCAPQDTLVSVLKRMTEGKFRHMPVLNGNDVVGIVTIGDVITLRLNALEHEALQLKQLIVG